MSGKVQDFDSWSLPWHVPPQDASKVFTLLLSCVPIPHVTEQLQDVQPSHSHLTINSIDTNKQIPSKRKMGKKCSQFLWLEVPYQGNSVYCKKLSLEYYMSRNNCMTRHIFLLLSCIWFLYGFLCHKFWSKHRKSSNCSRHNRLWCYLKLQERCDQENDRIFSEHILSSIKLDC